MRWSLRGTGVCGVQSYYGVLQAPRKIYFPWRRIWCVKAPKQVAFFVWTAAWRKILTNDNLRKRGITLIDWCCLCRCSGVVGGSFVTSL